MHTKFSNLSDEEFLAQIDNIRINSPVIEELATRLEFLTGVPQGGTWTHDCPVCQAPLNCTVDEAFKSLVLEAD